MDPLNTQEGPRNTQEQKRCIAKMRLQQLHVGIVIFAWVEVLTRMAQTDDYVLNATTLETHPYNSQTKYSLQGKQAAGKHPFSNL